MKQRNKGIALITVLTMSGIMVLMLSAFIQLHRDQFSMVIADQAHEAAVDAARTAAELCTFQLEENRNWGQSEFPTAPVDSVVFGVLARTLSGSTHRLTGQVLATEATFTVDVVNNLDLSAQNSGVPAGRCRLTITASRGIASVRRELTLGTSPLYDSGVVASMGISIDANRLTVSSRDPFRNRLRSKGGIVVPDFTNGLRFDGAANGTRAAGANNVEKGLLWARNGIKTVNGKDLSNSTTAQQATVATGGGKFIPKASTNYNIHDLQRKDIQVPDNNVTIEPGVYVFTTAAIDYVTVEGKPAQATIPMLQRRAGWAINDDGQLEPGDIQEYWYLASDFPANGVPSWGQSTSWDSATAHQIANTDDGRFPIKPGVTASLATNHIDINPDVNVMVNGDFGVATDTDRTPVVQFKAKDGAYRQGSVSVTGKILIEGFIYGSGKLAAEGDVTLRPNQAVLTSDEQSELSIFSGGDVRIKPPTQSAQTQWDSDSYFRGLIYARNDVFYNAGGRNATIEGSVVARNGSVNFEAVNNANIIYNPAYLDSLVKNLADTHTRVERVTWKEL